MLRAELTSTFYELSTLLNDMKFTIVEAQDFGVLGKMNGGLKEHLVASLTPQQPKKEGLNLKNLHRAPKVVKLNKKMLKSLLI